MLQSPEYEQRLYDELLCNEFLLFCKEKGEAPYWWLNVEHCACGQFIAERCVTGYERRSLWRWLGGARPTPIYDDFKVGRVWTLFNNLAKPENRAEETPFSFVVNRLRAREAEGMN